MSHVRGNCGGRCLDPDDADVDEKFTQKRRVGALFERCPSPP